MTERSCQLTGKNFRLDPEAFVAYGLPLPAICPEERFRRLLSFKPGKQLFLRACSISMQKVFSVYANTAPFPVYAPAQESTEPFDGLEFGQDFDFKRLFMEQFLELWRRVPRPAAQIVNSLGSRLSDRVWSGSRSMLLFDSFNASACLYSTSLTDCSDCVDCYQLERCQSCYELLCSENCERTHFSEFCTNCKDSAFLFNCLDCSDCLFCVGLEKKRFHIFNQQVDEAEYRKQRAEFALHASPLLEVAKNRFREFLREQFMPAVLMQGVSSGSGNYLRNSIQVDWAFEATDCAEITNCHDTRRSKKCLDSLYISDSEEVAQSIAIVRGKKILNSVECSDVENVSYSSHCESGRELFACIGLKGKEYCIFNRQYTREKYQELFDQIKLHLRQRGIWGGPLPVGFSGHAYNRSAANEYMPLTKVPAKMMGFAWDDEDQVVRPSELLGDMQRPAQELFEDVPQEVNPTEVGALLERVYLCEGSGKPFQLAKAELEFLARERIAPPRVSFQQRFLERLSRLTPHEIQSAKDAETGSPIETAIPAKWHQPIRAK